MLNPVDHKQFTPAPVVGVDEVGRGCLAGPVYAGCVFLQNEKICELLTDSKLLSEKRREEIAPSIESFHCCGIGVASVEEIDRLNILQASFLAMRRAMEVVEKKLGSPVGHVLVDGNQKIPGLNRLQTAIVKGDLRCLPISAASIIAKVARDAFMRDLAQEYPQYGFEKHKGYASVMHRKVIAKIGLSPYHRKTFARQLPLFGP